MTLRFLPPNRASRYKQWHKEMEDIKLMEQSNFLMILFGLIAKNVCADSPEPHTKELANCGK